MFCLLLAYGVSSHVTHFRAPAFLDHFSQGDSNSRQRIEESTEHGSAVNATMMAIMTHIPFVILSIIKAVLAHSGVPTPCGPMAPVVITGSEVPVQVTDYGSTAPVGDGPLPETPGEGYPMAPGDVANTPGYPAGPSYSGGSLPPSYQAGGESASTGYGGAPSDKGAFSGPPYPESLNHGSMGSDNHGPPGKPPMY